MSVRSVEMREKRRKELNELIRWIRTLCCGLELCGSPCVCLDIPPGCWSRACRPTGDPLKEPVDWRSVPRMDLIEVRYNRGGATGAGLQPSAPKSHRECLNGGPICRGTMISSYGIEPYHSFRCNLFTAGSLSSIIVSLITSSSIGKLQLQTTTGIFVGFGLMYTTGTALSSFLGANA